MFVREQIITWGAKARRFPHLFKRPEPPTAHVQVKTEKIDQLFMSERQTKMTDQAFSGA
jgi:hypothetical protein